MTTGVLADSEASREVAGLTVVAEQVEGKDVTVTVIVSFPGEQCQKFY